MGRTYLPVNETWTEYLKSCNEIYNKLQKENETELRRLAEETWPKVFCVCVLCVCVCVLCVYWEGKKMEEKCVSIGEKIEENCKIEKIEKKKKKRCVMCTFMCVLFSLDNFCASHTDP